MLGAQRMIEARIGQLLGPGIVGSNQHSVTTEGSSLDKDERVDFRVLSDAFKLLGPEPHAEWQKSRRALVSLWT